MRLGRRKLVDGTLVIVGSGQLGSALLRGLVRSGTVPPERVVCTDLRTEQLAALEAEHGVRTSTDNRTAVAEADVVVLGLKPQVLPAVLPDVAQSLREGALVISLAAGVTLETLEAGLPDGTAVVRVMSNTPVQVDRAMSVVAAGREATDRHLDTAEALLTPVGAVLRLDEHHLDAVTALSGSGPAYLFLFAEAMIEAGVLQGLPRDVATQLTGQTLLGAATLLQDSDQTPAALRAAVTSPGGTTAAALRTFEQQGLRAAVLDAVDAATQRSRALG
ncbi:pyrroline-5-carboxylate reductase [Nitriliruptor alkaliphilus]|uniref:pyrroline-5-carboxylate reductase n=1 Tax=Nitriliruptor alkaliphilus TaxID=427918 RepID=UPI0006973D14|nr:pyrroline-5-carboxylate reductase [Nitriliruptor alkaliphilus]